MTEKSSACGATDTPDAFCDNPELWKRIEAGLKISGPLHKVAEAIIADLQAVAAKPEAVPRGFNAYASILYHLTECLRSAVATSSPAVAFIEHHKGGDNLTWDPIHHPGRPATPLYSSPPHSVSPLATAEPKALCKCPCGVEWDSVMFAYDGPHCALDDGARFKNAAPQVASAAMPAPTPGTPRPGQGTEPDGAALSGGSNPPTDGWIEWRGGHCPGDPDAMIEYRCRDGLVAKGIARTLDWDHDEDYCSGDIVAYRVPTSATGTAQELAWLVETANQGCGALYWHGEPGTKQWVSDASKAARFPTREAASWAITVNQFYDTDVCGYQRPEPVEHCFIHVAPPPPAVTGNAPPALAGTEQAGGAAPHRVSTVAVGNPKIKHLRDHLSKYWASDAPVIHDVRAGELIAMCDALLRSASAINPSPNTLWMVYYEDAAVKPEIFFGEGAEAGARARYKVALDNWSCHLLVRVPTATDSNHR